MKNIIIKKITLTAILSLILIACDSEKLTKTPIDKFEGVWELEGRSMFDGMQIEITKDKDGEIQGRVTALNDNKYIQMFVEIGDTWISDIKRNSNFEFELSEKRVGSQLFSQYGLPSKSVFKVQFINDNEIGLSTGNTNPENSSIKYKRRLQ